MKGNLTMKRIVLLIVIVLLAAIVIKGPDSLIGLAKMSRSASDNGGSLPNVTGKATGVTGKKCWWRISAGAAIPARWRN